MAEAEARSFIVIDDDTVCGYSGALETSELSQTLDTSGMCPLTTNTNTNTNINPNYDEMLSNYKLDCRIYRMQIDPVEYICVWARERE
jgi:hypothetical protein